MFIKKKLKDLTKDDFEQWTIQNCDDNSCEECMFKNVTCHGPNSWVNSKESFSDKFLNQEIEIETLDVLDEVEKQYLTSVIKPFINNVISITKYSTTYSNFEYIYIYLKGMKGFSLPTFEGGKMYKGMKVNKQYTLKDLDL